MNFHIFIIQKNQMTDPPKQYREGHFIGLWIGISMAIFTLITIAFGFISETFIMIGIGPAIGVAIGVSVGVAVEDKYKKEGKIRPQTKQEKKRMLIIVLSGVGLLILGIVLFVWRFLSIIH
jgi:hypothetical protein